MMKRSLDLIVLCFRCRLALKICIPKIFIGFSKIFLQL